METIQIQTRTHTEFVDITGDIQNIVGKSNMTDGVVTVYIPHTTAGITINEGADPAVKRDILAVLNQIIPDKFDYRHMEGNSPAHIKTSVMGSSVQVLVKSGRLVLGTWQKIFFCEFDGPRNRKAWVYLQREV